jgi:hypothetical protein
VPNFGLLFHLPSLEKHGIGKGNAFDQKSLQSALIWGAFQGLLTESANQKEINELNTFYHDYF